MSRVRIPNEGEKISRQPGIGTYVYYTVREVLNRALSTRLEPHFKAELRELVGDAYVPVGRVSRATKADAIAAVHALAAQRGWHVHVKRLGWATYDAAYERAVLEAAEDAIKGRVPAPEPAKPRQPPQLLFSEVIVELHEILREAGETPIACYYGDLLHRLGEAADLVNARITSRGGLLLRELPTKEKTP